MIVPKTAGELSQRAVELFPDNDWLQRGWCNAVLWLRNQSKVGFAIDKDTERTVARGVLHGYTAPIEPIHTVVSLPDDQVIPGGVVDFKRRGGGRQ